MPFEEDIKEWAKLDTKIAEINVYVKELRNKRNDLEQSILLQVEERTLNSATIKLSDSRLRFVNSKINPPLTYKYLNECLLDMMNDSDAVDEIITYVREKREPKTTFAIKRFFNN
jgi:hypothetical protein